MKIVEKNPTPLTNPEVLSVLKERIESASTGSTGALNSEQEVLKTLEDRGTVSKTREEIEIFVAAIKAELPVTKEETLQLINHAPSTILDAYLCLEQAITDERIAEDQLDRVIDIVNQHLLQ